eukprot:5254952-Prymnesium_polylepis.1
MLLEADAGIASVTRPGASAKAWSIWEDNHDGYGSPIDTIDLPALFGTPPSAQCYGDILRTSVPATLMTVEFSAGENATFEWNKDEHGYWAVTNNGSFTESGVFDSAQKALLGQHCVDFSTVRVRACATPHECADRHS